MLFKIFMYYHGVSLRLLKGPVRSTEYTWPLVSPVPCHFSRIIHNFAEVYMIHIFIPLWLSFLEDLCGGMLTAIIGKKDFFPPCYSLELKPKLMRCLLAWSWVTVVGCTDCVVMCKYTLGAIFGLYVCFIL